MELYVASLEAREEKRGVKACMKRYRKKISNIIDAPSILIFVAFLAILDATFVVSQLIIDVIIVRQLLEKHVASTKTLSGVLKDAYPVDFSCYGEDHYDTGNLEDLISFLDHGDGYHGDDSYHGDGTNKTDKTHRKKRHLQTKSKQKQNNMVLSPALRTAMQNLPLIQLQEFCSKHRDSSNSKLRRFQSKRIERRETSSRETHDVNESLVSHEGCPNITEHHGEHEHDLAHTLAHACHIGSIVILTMMVFEKLLRIQAYGKKIFKSKFQMFDGFVVILSWILDLALIDGIWAQSEVDAALLLIILLPWRIIRIVNCFVMTFRERYRIQIRLIEEKMKASERKAKDASDKMICTKREITHLRDLASKHGASEKAIELCTKNSKDSLSRKTGMYLHSLSMISNILQTTFSHHDEVKDEVKDGHDDSVQTEGTPKTEALRKEIQNGFKEICSTGVETSDVHVDETTVEPTLTIEQPTKTMVPGETMLEPGDTMVQSVETIEQPGKTMVKPGETTLQPVETTVELVNTTVEPIETEVQPVKTAIQPVELIPQPVKTIEQPTKTIEQPGKTMVKPGETTLQPVETTVELVNTTVEPIETKVQPVKTAIQPVETIAQPVETIKQPEETMIEPLETTLQPLESTAQSSETMLQSPKPTTIKPGETTGEPAKTIKQSLETTSQLIKTTVQSAETTLHSGNI